MRLRIRLKLTGVWCRDTLGFMQKGGLNFLYPGNLVKTELRWLRRDVDDHAHRLTKLERRPAKVYPNL